MDSQSVFKDAIMGNHAIFCVSIFACGLISNSQGPSERDMQQASLQQTRSTEVPRGRPLPM